MVEIFKITGKRIVGISIIFYIIGAILMDYHIMIYNLIAKGELPEPQSTKIAVGSLLMFMAPIIWKGRNMVKRAVS